MRILMINTVATDRNGITNVIFNLLWAMDKQNTVVDYVSINPLDDTYADTIAAHGGQVFVVPRSMRAPFSYIRKLRTVLSRQRYDIIHVHGNSATMALEMLAGWLAGCKVRIAHSHNTTCKFMNVHRLLKPVFHILCTHRLACGTDAGKWLFENRSFRVVNNGIDTQRFSFCPEARQKLRRQYGVTDEQILLGHVGVFNEAKNQSFLIEVLSRLPSEKYKLLLVGEGPLKASVEDKVHQLHLEDRVIFAGVTDRTQDYYAAFDGLVMPSLHEGLPLVLVEAQCGGLQCVVSDSITAEADKTGTVRFLPLRTEVWIREIEHTDFCADRVAVSGRAVQKIAACGYDITLEAAKLKKYYEETI